MKIQKRCMARHRRQKLIKPHKNVRYSKSLMFDKPFLSIDEQIMKLRNRNLIFDNLVVQREILKRSNYYCIINGYKTSFLDTSVDIEKFKSGTIFGQVFSLFELDRDMRTLFLKYLLHYEEELKALITYHFSQFYNEVDGYLDVDNYDVEKKKEAYKIIKELSGEIYYQCSNSKARNYIKHYYEKHKFVPLWVLINSPTFGKVSKLFDCLPQSVRNNVAKDFGKRFKRDYLLSDNHKLELIDDIRISDINKIVNLFRNVCAHSEVLYLYTIQKPVKKLNIYFSNLSNNEIGNNNLFTLTCMMTLILPREKYIILLEDLERLFQEFENRVSKEKMCAILSEMGFPNNWKSKLI